MQAKSTRIEFRIDAIEEAFLPRGDGSLAGEGANCRVRVSQRASATGRGGSREGS